MCIISHLECITRSEFLFIYISIYISYLKCSIILNCSSHRNLIICSRSNLFFLCYRLRCCIKCIKTKF
nr:MAG TPA: hypothetical protein [Caudoviricetes sp.]